MKVKTVKASVLIKKLDSKTQLKVLEILAQQDYRCIKKYLVAYYNSFTTAEAEETAQIVAFAPIKFFKDIAKELSIPLKDIIELFKNSTVVKFFSKIGWSFSKLLDLLKTGYKKIKELEKVIQKFVEARKITKITKEVLEAFDKWLNENPNIKKALGLAVAAILIFIWFNMSFTGDVWDDFDLSDVVLALSGTFTLTDIFSGYKGLKLFTLFATGVLLKITFPWPGTDTIKFIAAIMITLFRKILNRRMESHSDSRSR